MVKMVGSFEVKDWDLSTNNYVFEEKSPGKHHLIRKDQVKMFRMPGEDPFQKIKLFKQEIFDLYCPSLHQSCDCGGRAQGGSRSPPDSILRRSRKSDAQRAIFDVL